MIYADMAIIAFFILSICVFIYVIITSRKYRKSNTDIKIEARKICNRWLKASVLCITVYYWCILCSIFSTLTVLHISCFEGAITTGVKYRIIFLSILAIFTSICPYVVDLKKMSKLYRNAFRILDEAILKNDNLEEAINKGEDEIDPII